MSSLNQTAVRPAARTSAAKVQMMPSHHPARYKHFLSRHAAALKPASPAQVELANRIAHFAWRLRQAIDIENRLIGAAAAKRDLRLYQQHVRGKIASRLEQLHALQGGHAAPTLAKMGSVFQMPKNGFVFSNKKK